MGKATIKIGECEFDFASGGVFASHSPAGFIEALRQKHLKGKSYIILPELEVAILSPKLVELFEDALRQHERFQPMRKVWVFATKYSVFISDGSRLSHDERQSAYYCAVVDLANLHSALDLARRMENKVYGIVVVNSD